MGSIELERVTTSKAEFVIGVENVPVMVKERGKWKETGEKQKRFLFGVRQPNGYFRGAKIPVENITPEIAKLGVSELNKFVK